MKKLVSLALTIGIALSMTINIIAAMPETLQPLWDNIGSMVSLIGFEESTGTATATATSKTGSSSMEGTLTVYKQTSSGWEYIDEDSDSTTGRSLGLEVTFDAESGEYYKAVFELVVTKNGVEETETKTSYKTCP